MRDIGNSTNVNFVGLGIVPQLLRGERCAGIKNTGSQIPCSYPPQRQFGCCRVENTGIEVQSLILM